MTLIQWLTVGTSLLLMACQPTSSDPLTIATAANMQFAMETLTEAFTNETGIACETVVSSSGKLTAQIREGAPYDVFVSADMRYPTVLYDNGLTVAEPDIYAYGRLVLWTTVDTLSPTLDLLKSEAVRHIALANPKTAPYGEAAIQVLHHYRLYDEVADKLVFGESIAQVNQFVSSRAAEVGFTAQAVVVSPEVQGQGRWQSIDTAAYTPIAQGAVILKNQTAPPEQAQQFYDFLFSSSGKEVLTRFGYAVSDSR